MACAGGCRALKPQSPLRTQFARQPLSPERAKVDSGSHISFLKMHRAKPRATGQIGVLQNGWFVPHPGRCAGAIPPLQSDVDVAAGYGRGDQFNYSRRVLTRLREREFRHLSKRGAAIAIYGAIERYLGDGFEKNFRAGLFPPPDNLDYHLHDLILNSAVVISGKVVDIETSMRRFVSPQIVMCF